MVDALCAGDGGGELGDDKEDEMKKLMDYPVLTLGLITNPHKDNQTDGVIITFPWAGNMQGTFKIIPAPVAEAAVAVIEAARALTDEYIEGYGNMGILKEAIAALDTATGDKEADDAG